jgi:hypothetical protein
MSRYNWGQRHPGIDRLEEIRISQARARLWDGILLAIGERMPAAS